MTGVGYTRPFANGSALRLMLQYDRPEIADGKFRAGAEYAFSKYVALRVGYDDSNISFGLGVTASTFGLDYAMLSRDTAGSSHPVTFNASYGKTLDEQRQAAAEQRAREDQQVIRRAFDARVKEHRDKAMAEEAEGNLAGALDEWKVVLDLAPGDPDATARINSVTVRLVEEQEKAARDMVKQREITARFAEGLRLYQENDYAASREAWRAILAIDSTHAEAKDYLERTQAEIEKEIRAHARRASQFEQSGRLTEAIGEWNNVESLDPGNRQAKAAVERIRKRIEDQSQNLEQASKKLEIVNLYNDALQAFNQGEYDKAIAGLDKLLALEPGHEEAKNLRAMAIRKITPLTKQEEDEIRKLFLRGMEYFAKDEYAKAIEQWQKILDIDPTNESVKRNIDEAKERLKQIEEHG
jgi:cytochrome c-type biogenesis protein CcmH/NrfG